MYRCDQSNIADSDDPPLTLVFDDVPFARLLQIDGAQDDSIFERCKILQLLCTSVASPNIWEGRKNSGGEKYLILGELQ